MANIAEPWEIVYQKKVTCPACEGLGVMNPEVDPMDDCPICEAEGLCSQQEADKFYYNNPAARDVKKIDMSIQEALSFYMKTGLIFSSTSFKRIDNDSITDSIQKSGDYSIFSRRRTVDLQGPKKWKA